MVLHDRLLLCINIVTIGTLAGQNFNQRLELWDRASAIRPMRTRIGHVS